MRNPEVTWFDAARRELISRWGLAVRCGGMSREEIDDEIAATTNALRAMADFEAGSNAA